MNKSSRTRNSILNLVTGFGGQFLVVIMSFITRTVFIQILGKSYLGINGLFSDILTMLSLTELGFDTAINFKLYKPLAEHDTKQIRILMKFYKKAYEVIGLVILIVGLCLIPFLHLLIKDYDNLALLGINATLVFSLYLLRSVSSYLFFAYKSAIVKADQRQYLISLADYVVTIISNVCQIIVLIVWRNFILYTGILVLFSIVQNLVNATIAQHYYPEVFVIEKDTLSKNEVVGLFKDCGALFAYKANGVVLKATDNIVLSAFIGTAIVGMYSNYLLFYTTIKAFLGRFYSATKASMGNLYAVADIEKKYSFFEVMNFISIVFYGTAALGVATLANELIRVWIGNDYIISQPFPILMGLEILMVGLKENLGQVRNVSGIFRQMWYRPILGIFINIIVSVILVQYIGIYGVLIGTIVADVTTFFTVDPIIIYKYSFNGYKPVTEYYTKNIVYIIVLGFIGIADTIICSVVILNEGWLCVILHILLVSCSVPIVFIVLFRKTNECKYLLNTVIKRFIRFR